MTRKCPIREQAKNYDYQGTSQSVEFLGNHIIRVLKMNKN